LQEEKKNATPLEKKKKEKRKAFRIFLKKKKETTQPLRGKKGKTPISTFEGKKQLNVVGRSKDSKAHLQKNSAWGGEKKTNGLTPTKARALSLRTKSTTRNKKSEEGRSRSP